MITDRTPVVFLHGLWLHTDSWGPWAELFREAGYTPVTPGWPGDSRTVEVARQRPEQVARYGIDDVVDHYTAVIASLDVPPILVGHSLGGLIAQRLLGEGLAAAAVALASAPIKGVSYLSLPALRVASIALRNPANNGRRAVSLTPKQFRYGFGNALSRVESDELYERWAIPSPGVPLFELTMASLRPRSPAKVDTGNMTRGPLLLIAGGRDHTAPPSMATSALRQYSRSRAVTDYKEYPDRGHSLGIDRGWTTVAEETLGWLKKQGR